MALDPISAALDLGGKLVDRFIPDPAAAAAAKLELDKMQLSGELTQLAGQIEVNKVEASNASVFISGWRPFIGWVAGFAMVYHFLFMPLVGGFFALQLPALDTANLFGLTTQLLGMAALRTYEKINGVAAK